MNGGKSEAIILRTAAQLHKMTDMIDNADCPLKVSLQCYLQQPAVI